MSTSTSVRRTARRRRKVPAPLVVIALVVLALAVLAAAVGPMLFPRATAQDLMLGISGPGDGHLLGTDDLGRDVAQMVVVGARSALVGAFAVALGSMLIGHLVGLPAGYLGGWVDTIAMRWADLMFSLPALLVAIVVTGVLGGGYAVAVMVLTALFSPGDTRVVRAAVLEQRRRPYVEAARLSNLRGPSIVFRHIWPNIAPIVTGNAFLNFAFALVALASLSFLGLGVEPGSPDWGRTLAENRSNLSSNPWAATAPGLAIILTAASVSIVGDWIHHRLDQRSLAR